MQCIGNFGSKICSRVPGKWRRGCGGHASACCLPSMASQRTVSCQARMAAYLAALAGLLVVRPQDWFLPPLSAGPPGLSSVTQVYDDTKPGDLIFTVVLTAPASDGGSREQQLGFFCRAALELCVGVPFMARRQKSLVQPGPAASFAHSGPRLVLSLGPWLLLLLAGLSRRCLLQPSCFPPAAVNKYELWATNEVGTKIGPVSSVSVSLPALHIYQPVSAQRLPNMVTAAHAHLGCCSNLALRPAMHWHTRPGVAAAADHPGVHKRSPGPAVRPHVDVCRKGLQPSGRLAYRALHQRTLCGKSMRRRVGWLGGMGVGVQAAFSEPNHRRWQFY